MSETYLRKQAAQKLVEAALEPAGFLIPADNQVGRGNWLGKGDLSIIEELTAAGLITGSGFKAKATERGIELGHAFFDRKQDPATVARWWKIGI